MICGETENSIIMEQQNEKKCFFPWILALQDKTFSKRSKSTIFVLQSQTLPHWNKTYIVYIWKVFQYTKDSIILELCGNPWDNSAVPATEPGARLLIPLFSKIVACLWSSQQVLEQQTFMHSSRQRSLNLLIKNW